MALQSDLARTSTGELKLPLQLATGADAFAQRLKIRFRWWKGEWFADTRQGVPYLEKVFVKNPDRRLLRYIFRQIVLTTPGCRSLLRFQIQYDTTARSALVDFEAQLTDGTIFRTQPDQFIIRLPR